MSEPVTDKQILDAGGTKPNPASGDAKATPPTEPATQKAEKVNSGPNVDDQIKALTEKIDRLSSQYDGSTKEALRLKEENEKLKAQIETAKESGSTVKNEKEFQKIVEDKGLVAALDEVFGNKVSSLEKRVEGLLEKESKKIYNDFVSSHKGLLDATVNQKFEAELSKLKGVYSDVFEAMEKAYVLAGGKELEEKPPAPKTPTKSEEDVKKEKDLLNTVTGGDEDKRPSPPVAPVDPAKQISDLRAKAASLELQGKLRQAAELYAQIEDIRGKLSAKV